MAFGGARGPQKCAETSAKCRCPPGVARLDSLHAHPPALRCSTRAGGRCETCGRPGHTGPRCLPDGRWQDPSSGAWRHRARPPHPHTEAGELAALRITRVVLARHISTTIPATTAPQPLPALPYPVRLAVPIWRSAGSPSEGAEPLRYQNLRLPAEVRVVFDRKVERESRVPSSEGERAHTHKPVVMFGEEVVPSGESAI